MQEQRVKGFVSVKPEGYIKPLGVTEITENGTYNVKEFEFANVNVKGNEGGSLKKLLDVTKSTSRMFQNQTTITDLTGLIEYNDTENVENMSYMFSGCSRLIESPYIDMSSATNTSYMFQGCSKLEKPNISYDFAPTQTTGMFNKCQSLKEVPYFDISNVTEISYMFSECSILTTIPLFDTSKVTQMQYAFQKCKKLIEFPLLNTSNVTNLWNAFQGCESLEKLPLIDTLKVTNFEGAFYQCFKLKLVDLTYYKITSTSYSSNMFNSCYSLKAAVIRGFGTKYVLSSTAFNNCYHILGTKNSTYNPNGDKDGFIYVPRDMIAILEVASNWSTWATQLRALEDYTIDGTTTGELDLEKMGLGDLNE